ncbi:MAG: hypothetical protein ABIL09_16110 [Gemmatimonadota bacterium]
MAEDNIVPPEVVVVHWLDACSTSGWEEIETLPVLEPMRCSSAGFVASEDDDAIVLVQSVGGSTAVQARLSIPMGCVESIDTVKVPEGRKKARKRRPCANST